MLLQEKMQSTKFSPSEQSVVAFLLAQQAQIKDYGTPQIAAVTHTTPAVVVRVAKKLQFQGWRELKANFLAEVSYLQQHFQAVDANQPFTAQDNPMQIAGKLAQLRIETAQDTLALMDHDALQQAVQLLATKRSVNLFALAHLTFLAEEFVDKLRHLHKAARAFPIQNTMFQEAAMLTSEDCAICLSYSGESDPLFTALHLLKANHVPIIAVTSIGDNRLAKFADVTLRVTTREKAYSKIADFASLSSMALVLDTLYRSYFALNYERNYRYKVQLARLTEQREIDNAIIDE